MANKSVSTKKVKKSASVNTRQQRAGKLSLYGLPIEEVFTEILKVKPEEKKPVKK